PHIAVRIAHVVNTENVVLTAGWSIARHFSNVQVAGLVCRVLGLNVDSIARCNGWVDTACDLNAYALANTNQLWHSHHAGMLVHLKDWCGALFIDARDHQRPTLFLPGEVKHSCQGM